MRAKIPEKYLCNKQTVSQRDVIKEVQSLQNVLLLRFCLFL